MRTRNDLLQMQSLPLNLKIRLTKQRIRQWIDEFGTDGVYVSFSGGKDSTVLLNLVREDYPDVPAVFVNTGLEYPEIVQFVKTFDNVVIIKPKMNFKTVVNKYGYPFPSKEAAECIGAARAYLNSLGVGYQDGIENSEEFANLLEQRRTQKSGGANYRLARMLGMLTRDNRIVPSNTLHGRERSGFSQMRWAFLLGDDAPRVSPKCCDVMKKQPARDYIRKTGKKPFLATLAEESRIRHQAWIKHGCNGFDMEHPTSTPMAFWTEQDVLKYIKEYNIRIAPVYGKVVANEEVNDLPEGQLCFLSDEHILSGTVGVPKEAECTYKTTGCSRTGCMFCGFGCHLENLGEGRFLRMKETHPKLYEWIMKPREEGGLDYKHVIDWINEHGNLHIEY